MKHSYSDLHILLHFGNANHLTEYIAEAFSCMILKAHIYLIIKNFTNLIIIAG